MQNQQPGRTELVELRTAYAKVYQEADGSRTAVVTTEPVHYETADGRWAEIDNRLEPNPHGRGYVNRAGGNSFSFAEHGRSPALVAVGNGQGRFSFGIEGAHPQDAAVDGNEATYRDVLPETDVRLSLHGETLKEIVVLKAPPAVSGEEFEMRFPLALQGLRAVERTGGVILEDHDGEVVFRLPKPFMFDSANEGPLREAAFSEDIRFELEEGLGGQPTLALVADAEWLMDEERVYPVFLDPSVYGPNTPSVDTYVQSNIFNTPQDQLDELKSGYYEGPQSPEPITTRSLLKFDLGVISQGSTINDATLSVWNKHSYICTPTLVNVHRVTSNWNSSVTWTNRPTFEPTYADQQKVAKGVDCGNAGYVGFDVRSVVSWWKNTDATNEGFMLKADDESNVLQWKKWASDQAGNKPQLVVNYSEANRAPAVPVLQSPVQDATVRNVSPTFSAWYQDADNDSGRDEFQVFRASDSLCSELSCAYRWGHGTQVQSGSWSHFAADRDLPSGRYKWRARAFDGSRRSEWSNVSYFWIDAPDPPTITEHPSDYTNVARAKYSFSGGSTFECVLEYVLPSGEKRQHSSSSPCTSPKEYFLQDDAAYTFKVAAINPNDGTNRSPYATHSFTLDRVAPVPPAVNLVEPASSPGTSRAIKWTFSGEPGGEFRCALTGPQGPISSSPDCASPQTLDLLPTAPDGTYKLEVWQKDAASNISMPGVGSYVLDTKAPDPPRIDGGPPDRTRNAVVEWRFSGETGATFQCRLSREGVEVYEKASCPSPKTYTLTQDGTYTLEVWQRDLAGNESPTPTPTTDSFVLDRTTGKPTFVRSTTHVPHVAMKVTQIDMAWNAAQDDSGIDGYYWTFLSQAPEGTGCAPGAPGTMKNEEHELTAQSAAGLGAGQYWFKICAADNLGNVGEPVTYGPLIVSPQGSPIVLSPTLPSDLVAQSDTNGLEQFYAFRSFDLGHYAGYANLDTGNLVVQATDFAIPGKGLNTVIRHTYNSSRTDPGYHDTGLGRGWSLSLADADAGLDFVGSATEIDLNTPVVPTFGQLAGMAAGVTGGILELTDGDGTVHRFTRHNEAGGRWDAPPGVDLRVRENRVENDLQSYDLIRPDGVVYRVRKIDLPVTGLTDTWHVAEVFDRNGNKLLLDYDNYGSATDKEEPTVLPKIRVAGITRQPAGEASDDVVAFTYDGSGRLESIDAIPGDEATDQRRIAFGYDGLGYLTTVTEHPEDAEDQRLSVFGYRTYERDKLNALDDVRLLDYIQDGEGNKTHFEFDDGSSTGWNRVSKICDRVDDSSGDACENPTTIDYGAIDPNSGVHETNVTVPVAVAPDPARETLTSYRISGRGAVSDDDRRIAGGNVIRITDDGNPDPVIEHFDWAQNLLVKKTDGAGHGTFMHYNSLGLVTKIDSPPVNLSRPALPDSAPTGRVETTFVHDGVEGDAYPADKCPIPPNSGHPQISTDLWCDSIAETVRTKTRAVGHGGARITDFDYDPGGNLEKVLFRKSASVDLPSDPDTGFSKEAGDRLVRIEPNLWGGISAVRGPRDVNDDVTYPTYDQTGMPETITDAAGNSKTFEYSPYGEMLQMTDRDLRTYVRTYDLRGNLETTTDPTGDKTSYSYDKNDNQIGVVTPRGNEPGAQQSTFETTTDRNENEWPTETFQPGAAAENPSLKIFYNLDGTKAWQRNEVGARTTFGYYANRQLKETVHPTGTGDEAVMTISYDSAGRRSLVRLPFNGSARPERRFTYSPAGAIIQTSETSAVAQDRVTSFAYDAFGARVQVLGPRREGDAVAEQLAVYNPWGELTKLSRLVKAGRFLEYRYEYDDGGNLHFSEHPTGNGEWLRTRFDYNTLNRLVEQTDPQNPGHLVRYTYTAEGDQKTRSDVKDDTNVQRRIVHEYNPDHSVRWVVAEDRSGSSGVETLALCNFSGTDYAGGYDANGNLLRARTVRGSDPHAPCDEPDVLRSEIFEYDARDRLHMLTQTVKLPGMAAVERTQTLDYRADGLLDESTWAGRLTDYEHSTGGVLQGVSDWREGAPTVVFDHFPAGNLDSVTIPGAASAATTYHPDGSPASLLWRTAAGNVIRRHDEITYDVGGLRKSEDVTIAHPASALGRDGGGLAKFDYDLAGRLTSWTSPFRLSERETSTSDSPRTAYDLDDGGNIKVETVAANDGAGRKWIERTSDYQDGRLESKTVKSFGLTADNVTVTTTIDPSYDDIGQEKTRSTSLTATLEAPVPVSDTRSNSSTTSYDPGGHTRKVDFSGMDAPQDVDYVYAADGQLIARTVDGRTTYLFYFASGSRLAEQTRPSGATKTRYLNSPTGSVMAQQHYKDGPTGEPLDLAPTWTWLLRDTDGNVATEVTPEGTVAAQRAYDPYGSRDGGGTSRLEGHDRSDLGFQSDYTDGATGNVAMGPRLYDPTTARFTTADFYGGAASDATLATDALTGNRYLFAAANPVAFYDDGHEPCPSGMNCNELYSGETEASSFKAHDERHVSAVLDLRTWRPNERFNLSVRFIYQEMMRNYESYWSDDTGPTKLLRFYERMRTGGVWDFKPDLEKMLGLDVTSDYHYPVPGFGVELYYDVWANIHYGYVGKALGFGDDVLQKAAGLGTAGTGVNDAPDRLSIQLGINLWDKYGPNLLEVDVRLAVQGAMFNYVEMQRANPRLNIVDFEGNGF